jgi:Fe-coproporphyrin III synthase
MQAPTVQVHLNRLCNLACLHCYSRSGPTEREALELEDVRRFLADARRQGYEVVGFSGGEPFLYPAFRQVVEAAREYGLAPIAVTNATVLREEAEAILPLLDLVAVSVDGPEPVHNRLRGSATAFARMVKGLDTVRRSGVRFGIAHTVTRESLPHLPWVAEFARSAGAEVLQLHPLGLVGAAADHALEEADGETLARTYLTALALRAEYGAALRIHVDLFNRAQLRRQPCLVVPPERAGGGTRLADVLNPLVLLSNGDVAPICHGLADAFPITNIGRERLSAAAPRYLADELPRFHHFCRRLAKHVSADEEGWPYLNWYRRRPRPLASPRRPRAERRPLGPCDAGR